MTAINKFLVKLNVYIRWNDGCLHKRCRICVQNFRIILEVLVGYSKSHATIVIKFLQLNIFSLYFFPESSWTPRQNCLFVQRICPKNFRSLNSSCGMADGGVSLYKYWWFLYKISMFTVCMFTLVKWVLTSFFFIYYIETWGNVLMNSLSHTSIIHSLILPTRRC